jgi:hypothetical protein
MTKRPGWLIVWLVSIAIAQGLHGLSYTAPVAAAAPALEVVGALRESGRRAAGVRVSELQQPWTARHSSVQANDDGTRIEYEVKLRVPLEEMEAVWVWLQMRYADPSWLNVDGYVFQASFGDEDFTDTYFDTPDLRLLEREGGVRHRVRVVHTGPADSKDGRELLQVKLDRGDIAGVARSEIKFDVARPGDGSAVDEAHPLLSLVRKRQREEFATVFSSLRVNPYDMYPVLTITQNRRRIYLSDQDGAFATLTLDLCATNDWGVNLRWSEVELELNEIRYTEADGANRERMERVVALVQADLLAIFPNIVPDQTPKYNTAFTSIEATTRLPLRRLIKWRITLSDFLIIAAASLLAVCGTLGYAAHRWFAASAPKDSGNRLKRTAYRPL